MKIKYDHQAFTGSNHGGISRYFVEIIAELQKIKLIEASITVAFSNNQHLKAINQKNVFSIPKFGKNTLMPLIASQLNKINSLRSIAANEFDVFHPTYFHDYFLKSLKKPFVITFHDTTAEDFPEFENLGRNDILRKKLLEQAARIIAISECTKADIIRHYQIDPTKIDVIYHATRFAEIKAKHIDDLPEKYLLYVGQRGFYKNFNDFLSQAADFLKQHHLPLVCIGGGEFTAEEKTLINDLGLENLAKKYQADDDNALLYAYQKAAGFVYPSRLEGFGIPILEAFAAQCPMLLSNIPVFKEIAKDAALYFDLDNKTSLEIALNSILSLETRQAITQKGTIRLKNFNWKKSAEMTLECYRKAVQHHSL
jgi:glycosyltransferase involved in cell wall biosynthesis